MNVPTGFCAWVVDTVPIDPEAPASAVLNAIVIAYVFLHRYDGRGSTFFVLWFCFQKPRSVVPPFWCNAFRAVSVFDTGTPVCAIGTLREGHLALALRPLLLPGVGGDEGGGGGETADFQVKN